MPGRPPSRTRVKANSHESASGPAHNGRSRSRSRSDSAAQEVISISSDPIALNDDDISPFRPIRTAARGGVKTVRDSDEDDENALVECASDESGSRSRSASVLIVDGRQSRNGVNGKAKKINNARAGPSRSTGEHHQPLFDPSVSPSDSEASSENVFLPERRRGRPSRRPIARESSTPIPADGGRGRGSPVVEISLLPFSELRRYAVRPGSTRPTQGSRDLLRGLTPDPSSEASPSPKPMRPRWKVTSSPSFGESDEDDIGSYDSASTSGSESDQVALRRSGRRSKDTRGRGGNALVSSRTRSRYYEPSRETSYISSVSEGAFYGSTSRNNKRKAPPSGMAKGKGKARRGRKQTTSSEEADEMEVDDYENENESELDELESESESDYNDRKKRKSKGKGKMVKEEEVDENVLRQHRQFCEKCSREPADDLLEKAQARKKKRKGPKRKKDDDEISDEELAGKLEGWLECTECVVASHWGCLAPKQQKDVLAMLALREGREEGSKPRRSVEIDETTIFTCTRCAADDKCFVCHEDDVKDEKEDDAMEVDGEAEAADVKPKSRSKKETPLLFRCLRCKQKVHYEHLDKPTSLGEDPSLPEIAQHYQLRSEEGSAWTCHQCRSWTWGVDLVIAWRPCPADVKEAPLDSDEFASWKDPLPREYLVKWTHRGFRHITWASHAWLQAIAPQRLRNFLVKGPTLDLVTDATLAAKGDEIAEPTIAKVLAEDDQVIGGGKSGPHHPHHSQHSHEVNGKEVEWTGGGPGPDPDAQSNIPALWSTIDRVLDVMLLPPSPQQKNQKPKAAQQRRGQRILSVSVTPSEGSTDSPINNDANGNSAKLQDQEKKEDRRARLGLKDGLKPPEEMMIDIDEWEERTGKVLGLEDVEEVADLVTWCYVKWEDLQYDQSCWDTPPPINSTYYPAFKRALARFLRARQIDVPVLTAAQCRQRDHEAERAYVPPQEQPDCIVGGKLMPFQLEGVQWLLYNYFKRHSCILADDMGLGKTVQIASFLGYLGSDKHRIYPSLVVVPNSTITNWVREFEKWVPHMQVVPYYGEAASRKVISKYELYHKGMQNKAAGLKAHVVLTTYDMITGSEFRVFGGIPRWEVLCVDEGQRLKSDNSLIFNRLKTLNSMHRILLTGTPLNNNLRELFNLLNFLDPQNFKELFDLEKRFENLNEGLIGELHEMIKPYILRRIKADVLKLPPKVEIIVPITLAPLQKRVYKSIFEKNAELIQAILKARQKKLRAI